MAGPKASAPGALPALLVAQAFLLTGLLLALASCAGRPAGLPTTLEPPPPAVEESPTAVEPTPAPAPETPPADAGSLRRRAEAALANGLMYEAQEYSARALEL